MKNENLGIRDVLEMISTDSISPEEGLQIYKDILCSSSTQDDDSELLVYNVQWEKDEIDEDIEKLEGNILLFDTDESLYNSLKDNPKLKNSNIILVLLGKRFKHIRNQVFEIGFDNKEEYSLLFKQIMSEGLLPDKVIHSWSKDLFDGNELNLKRQLKKSVYSILYITQSFMELKLRKPIKILYTYYSNSDKVQPQYAGVSGLMKTINLENRDYIFKSVEFSDLSKVSHIPDSNELITPILKELQCIDGKVVDIKYKNNERFVSRLNEFDLNKFKDKKIELKKDRVYLITGGLGGLGLIFAEFLIDKYQAKLVLTGRSELDENKEKILENLKSLGSEVMYVKADISLKDDVNRLIEEAKKRFGNINGVINCAGVTQDALSVKKNDKEMEKVFAPKIFGTINLDKALKDENLEIFINFSSTTAEIGNVGQCDYAYANSFIDHYCKLLSFERNYGKVLSINWSLWKDGGMNVGEDKINSIRHSLGIKPLDTDKGTWVFEHGLQVPFYRFLVFQGYRDKLQKIVSQDEKEHKTKLIKKENINNKDKEKIRKKVEKYLKDVLSKEIRLSPEKIDSEEPLEIYGIDSIMITSLNKELENDFGELPKTLFFEYQSISQLTDYFADKHLDKFIQNSENEEEKKPTKMKFEQKIDKNRSSRTPYRYMKKGHSLKDDVYIKNQDIAIVGISGRYPMSDNVEEFWNNLAKGKDCITEIPIERWDYTKDYSSDRTQTGKSYSKWGGFINHVDKFDPLFFSISPKEAELLDPQERLFLQTVWHTLEDAGYIRNTLKEKKVGVFVGVMYGHYQLYGAEESQKGNVIALSSSYASVANRVSYYFNFNGPSLAVDTMCSSSLTTIHLACDSIKKGESEVAIAGGVNVSIHPNKYIYLSQGKFVSSDGRCRSFGEGGDGYVPGEGVGAVVLKPLEKAIKDKDHIYAVIKGTSINHGGKTNGYTVPNPNAQAEAILDTLKKSKVDPRTINYIEAHGTGTSLGDPIEIAGLVKAFGEYTDDKQYCSIGSVKSNIGHLESAAGIAGITKLVLQMKYKKLLPSIHSSKFNGNINFKNTPFHVQHELEDWKPVVLSEDGKDKKYPRRAGISSFGAGGANAHIILEEYENRIVEVESKMNGEKIIVLSAKNEERLKEYASKLYEFLQEESHLMINGDERVSIDQIAYTLHMRREPMEQRVAFLVSNIQELIEQLQNYCEGRDNKNSIFTGNTKIDKDKIELLVHGDDEKEIINNIIEHNELAKLSQLWVHGFKVDWSLLYSEEIASNVSLPKYPFAQERYWVPITEKSRYLTKSMDKLHPLIDVNTSNLKEQKFVTKLIGNEYYIEDHVIFDKKLFPGAAYIELARAAGEIASEEKVRKIKNISWTQPIVLENNSKEVTISIYPDTESIKYEIRTVGANKDILIVHSQGEFEFVQTFDNEPNKIERINIDEIKNKCIDIIEQEEFYEKLSEKGFKYGQSFRVIKQLYSNERESLALLKLPDILEIDFDEYILHPSLIDGAFQSVGELLDKDDKKSNDVYLPFAIGEIEINKKIAKECYVYVSLDSIKQDYHKGIKKYNITIIDKDGYILSKITDYTLKKYNKGQKNQGTLEEKSIDLLQKLYDGELKSEDVSKVIKG